MPKFMDYHAKMPQMPPAAVKQMQDMLKAKKKDQFGVTPLTVYMGNGGQCYCLTEAPNADAVRKSHQANGGPAPDQVVEVTSMP
jgi:hypothetical protein